MCVFFNGIIYHYLILGRYYSLNWALKAVKVICVFHLPPQFKVAVALSIFIFIHDMV